MAKPALKRIFVKMLTDKYDDIRYIALRRYFQIIRLPVGILEQKSAGRIRKAEYAFSPVHLPRQLCDEFLEPLAVNRPLKIVGVNSNVFMRMMHLPLPFSMLMMMLLAIARLLVAAAFPRRIGITFMNLLRAFIQCCKTF